MQPTKHSFWCFGTHCQEKCFGPSVLCKCFFSPIPGCRLAKVICTTCYLNIGWSVRRLTPSHYLLWLRIWEAFQQDWITNWRFTLSCFDLNFLRVAAVKAWGEVPGLFICICKTTRSSPATACWRLLQLPTQEMTRPSCAGGDLQVATAVNETGCCSICTLVLI